MNETNLRNAIRAKLLESSELAVLLDKPEAIYHRKAPSGSERPYVVFQKMDGRRVLQFGDFHLSQIWLVKGVCITDAEQAEAIDEVIADFLPGEVLDIEGAEQLYLQRDDDFDYDEIDEGNTQIFHVGGRYQLMVQP